MTTIRPPGISRPPKSEHDNLTEREVEQIPLATLGEEASIPIRQTREGGVSECRRLLLEVAFGALGAARWLDDPEGVGLAAEAASTAHLELTAATAILERLLIGRRQEGES